MRYDKMIIEKLENKLNQMLFEKKQEVIRLRWKKAQLEKQLELMKQEAQREK